LPKVLLNLNAAGIGQRAHAIHHALVIAELLAHVLPLL
jgi:hypothetical protein